MSQLFDLLELREFAPAAVHQIHSSRIVLAVRNKEGVAYEAVGQSEEMRPTTEEPSADALLAASPGLLLTIRTADCLPVLLIDPRRRAVAAIHAGWRGVLDRIVEKTVGALQQVLGVNPSDLSALLGPSIQSCCYEIGAEVVNAFRERFIRSDRFFRHAAGRQYLDLAAAVRHQLHEAGVASRQITASNLCTRCRADLFYSFRREGVAAGRMVAAIGIRTETASSDGDGPVV